MHHLPACSDPAKVRKLLRTLKETSGNRSVYGYAYDLSSMQQTASFAAHLRKDLELWFGGRLNVLVNNAACLAEDLHVTQVGLIQSGLCLHAQSVPITCLEGSTQFSAHPFEHSGLSK